MEGIPDRLALVRFIVEADDNDPMLHQVTALISTPNQSRGDHEQPALDFRGPWFDARTAAASIG
jgi:hypothetical protein